MTKTDLSVEQIKHNRYTFPKYGALVVFQDGEASTPEEAQAYLEWAINKYAPRPVQSVFVNRDGEEAGVNVYLNSPKFERVRRITGYLVGTVDRFNNAKQSEVKDRVKHGLAYTPANQCVSCGAEMAEGDHVCKACRDMTRVDRAPGFDSRRDG